MNACQSVRECVERHFQRSVEGPLGRIVLNRPERNNPLKFEPYAQLRSVTAVIPGQAG